MMTKFVVFVASCIDNSITIILLSMQLATNTTNFIIIIRSLTFAKNISY